MMELFDNAKLETSASTRAKAARLFGLDEPPVTEKLDRASFATDEEYLHAATELSLRNHSPEYRREYERLRRQFTAQQEEQRQAQEEKQHQMEIARAVQSCILSQEEQQRIDAEARSRAQADLAIGKIGYAELGPTVTRYAEALTQETKELKVHNAYINARIWSEMSQITRRNFYDSQRATPHSNRPPG